MHTQVSTRLAEPSAFVSALHREEMLRERRERARYFKAPIDTEGGRIGRILSGSELAPSFAVAVMADAHDVDYAVMAARLRALMVPALYLADCSVAELRHISDPIVAEVLAGPVVKQCGLAHLAKMDRAALEAADDAECKRIYPKPGRQLAAVDAAFTWEWTRFPTRS